jgi:hypothetical protein
MMRVSLGCVLMGVCLASTGVLAQSVPPAIFTDPPADSAHPAAMTVLHIPSHGALINGLVYSPPKVTAMHVDTDHSWSDHRIALESSVITWLAGLN